MQLTIEQFLEKMIYIIIIIKILFLASAVGTIFFKHYKKNSPRSETLDTKFTYWKERTEFTYIICMALLIIYIFNPWYNHQKYIHKQMSFLFFLFGLVLIITSKWSIFIKEASWYKKISDSLK